MLAVFNYPFQWERNELRHDLIKTTSGCSGAAEVDSPISSRVTRRCKEDDYKKKKKKEKKEKKKRMKMKMMKNDFL